MWPHQKDRSARGGKIKCFSRIARSWQSSIYRSDTFTDYRLHSEIMDLYYASIEIKSVSEMVSYPQGTSLSRSKKTAVKLSFLLFPKIVYSPITDLKGKGEI